MSANDAAFARQIATMQSQMSVMAAKLQKVEERPMSVWDEINQIEGRRVDYVLSQDLSFTITQLGARSSGLSFQVSQDGPFIMTHYPMVSWWVNAPSNADNLGKYGAIGSWPLPTQQQGTSLDSININYEIYDSGSQRGLQTGVRSQGLLSYPGALMKMPQPVIFAAAAQIQFYCTFLDIDFATAPTNDSSGGNLHVDLVGFRCVNL
jgi:hypothetical protein